MKKYFILFLLTGIAGLANAQTTKGDWMAGGNISLNTSDNNTQISFSPTLGGFVIDNLAIGGEFLLDYSKTGNNKVTNFGFGPFVRYYFTTANIRPIVQGSLGYISQHVKTNFSSSTNNGSHYFLGGGAAIFISNQVSLDILMGYDHTKYSDFDGSGGFKLGVGFQVYLLKRQVDKIRGNK
ncbi:MAG: outer membrane beta-barrel protein [Bacteroidetes bacterium]|nr:outer membrane beta-barrel protein [Bacteroidota bacterium]MBS1930223.1 outer membrane beta-barrel protein [Bacteroidota bacterium]